MLLDAPNCRGSVLVRAHKLSLSKESVLYVREVASTGIAAA